MALRSRELAEVFIPVPVEIQNSKRGCKVVIWAVLGILLSAGAKAVAPDTDPSDYQGIVNRNVFDLRAPLARANPGNPVPESRPKITLNGITTITGKKITFLTVSPTKPGTPPQTLMLAEGQAEDEVEIQQINEKAGVVKVVNHGEAETLDFEHNGAQPAAVVPGGAPARPVTIPPMSEPAQTNAQPVPNIIRPIRALPTRHSPGSIEGDGAPLTREQMDTLIEAQRYKALQENDPMAKILPPTAHTQEIINSFEQGQSAPQ